MRLKILIPACLFLIFVACPTVDPPEVLPPGVKIIPFSSQTSATERGIRPKEGTQNILIIEWDDVETQSILDRYDVYRSRGIDSTFILWGSVLADDPTLFEDTRVNLDTAYYYFVVAVDSKENMSDTSKYFENNDSIAAYIQSFRLGPKVALLAFPTISDDTVSTKPRFSWCLGQETQVPIKYVVRLALPPFENPIPIWIAELPYLGFGGGNCADPASQEYATFHNASYPASEVIDSLRARSNVTISYIDNTRLPGPRLSKTNYLWRVDCVFGTRYESRSGWMPFGVNVDY
ncbi:hypothetical protein K1X84_03935 [bacterium]|nr:hypothetical protein [bacterium]